MKKVQLICIGYAGSVAANFNFLVPYFGENILLSIVEYRGRGRRSKESAYKDNNEMAADAAEQLIAIREPELPYAVLGYSMGAQVVYEIFAQKLIKEMPVCIFLAAHEPPDVDCFGKNIDLENDTAFLENIKAYGGMDERLLQDTRFASIFISRMKADFALLKSYQFRGEYDKFPAEVVMMYCETDTPFEKIQGWSRFSNVIRFYEMGQSHFFFKTHTEEFCKIIKSEIEDKLEKNEE